MHSKSNTLFVSPFAYFNSPQGTVHLINIMDFDIYATSMNRIALEISLMDGDICKYDASNWLLCLVNCDSSLSWLKAKPPDLKLWSGNLLLKLIFYEKFVNLSPWFANLAYKKEAKSWKVCLPLGDAKQI